MELFYYLFALNLIVFSGIYCDISVEKCPKGSKICEFKFDIRYFRTMWYRPNPKGRAYDLELQGSSLKIVANSYLQDPKDAFINTVLNASASRDVISGDGEPRTVVTINGRFPGPTLEVWENAQVVVHVTNRLEATPISIHWHGMRMRETPWMDGVAYVTQCPILPGDIIFSLFYTINLSILFKKGHTFTYRFKAKPAGTHWYHGHFRVRC